MLLTGQAEVHPPTVSCHDGWQRDGPDPGQGHLCSHCFPAPQQRGQLHPADPGAQGQLEAPVSGLHLFGVTCFLKNCSFPNSSSQASALKLLFSEIACLPSGLTCLCLWGLCLGGNFFLVQSPEIRRPSMLPIAQAAESKFSFFSNKRF